MRNKIAEWAANPHNTNLTPENTDELISLLTNCHITITHGEVFAERIISNKTHQLYDCALKLLWNQPEWFSDDTPPDSKIIMLHKLAQTVEGNHDFADNTTRFVQQQLAQARGNCILPAIGLLMLANKTSECANILRDSNTLTALVDAAPQPGHAWLTSFLTRSTCTDINGGLADRIITNVGNNPHYASLWVRILMHTALTHPNPHVSKRILGWLQTEHPEHQRTIGALSEWCCIPTPPCGVTKNVCEHADLLVHETLLFCGNNNVVPPMFHNNGFPTRALRFLLEGNQNSRLLFAHPETVRNLTKIGVLTTSTMCKLLHHPNPPSPESMVLPIIVMAYQKFLQGVWGREDFLGITQLLGSNHLRVVAENIMCSLVVCFGGVSALSCGMTTRMFVNELTNAGVPHCAAVACGEFMNGGVCDAFYSTIRNHPGVAENASTTIRQWLVCAPSDTHANWYGGTPRPDDNPEVSDLRCLVNIVTSTTPWTLLAGWWNVISPSRVRHAGIRVLDLVAQQNTCDGTQHQ